MQLITISIERLRQAGHEVSAADGMPGLWNIAGLARDVTTNQLHALAEPYASLFPPLLSSLGRRVLVADQS